MSSISHAELDCRPLQREEYDVLESIYPECVSSLRPDNTLTLEIPVEFVESRTISLSQDGTLIGLGTDHDSQLSLSSLPPLLINITLPPSYPLDSPPQVTSIRTTHQWLLKPIPLQSILTGMWIPGDGVLYTWIEFIHTGDFLRSLGLTSESDDTIRILHPAPTALAPLLKDHDMVAKYSQFSQNSYPCSICLETLKGTKCIRLSCSHTFCRVCLSDFWQSCIIEGDIGRVRCPDPACIKVNREANAEEVARVVTEAELQRWRNLREKRDIEKDPTIIHCPMTFCQTPVPKSSDAEEGTGWERLRSCPACSLSFCAFCRRTWHGPHTPCPIAYSEKLVLDYLALAEGSSERVLVERRFGKANVLKLVKIYQEEQANKQWLTSSTTACPGCNVAVEKSLGCNHMTCTKCRQHFCYRCGTKLPPSDPYTHFSTVGTRCYNKLFDFQSGEDEWQAVEGFEDG